MSLSWQHTLSCSWYQNYLYWKICIGGEFQFLSCRRQNPWAPAVFPHISLQAMQGMHQADIVQFAELPVYVMWKADTQRCDRRQEVWHETQAWWRCPVHVHRVRQDYQDGDCPQCRHRIQCEGKRTLRFPCAPSIFGKNCRGDEAYV